MLSAPRSASPSPDEAQHVGVPWVCVQLVNEGLGWHGLGEEERVEGEGGAVKGEKEGGEGAVDFGGRYEACRGMG